MRVKVFLITTALLITFSCVSAYSQSKLNLKNKPIQNELLIEILNNSQMKELAPPLPKHSNFFLRLYSIGEFGTCAPEVEKEVTCSIRYYLAVSDGSLGVPGTVYDLGEVGEIIDVKWIEDSKSNVDKLTSGVIQFAKNSSSGIDRLRLEIINYPTHAFELNPKLTRKSKIVELEVSLNLLKIKEIK
jgi:hypothetical protein